MGNLGNVTLTNAVKIERTYDTSAAFMEAVGIYVEPRGVFFPIRKELAKGTLVELACRLPSGREIISAKARVIKFQSAQSGRPDGIWLKWEELTDRSQKNIAMIESWRKTNKE